MNAIEKGRLASKILRRQEARAQIPRIVHSRLTATEYVVPIRRWDDQQMKVAIPGSYRLLAGEMYEPEVTHALEAVIAPGDTVLDIGGHFGEHALTMSRRVGIDGSVIVFEPSPDIVPVLRQNTKPRTVNDLRQNILVKPYAVNDGSRNIEYIHQYPIRYSGLNTITDQPRFTVVDHNLPVRKVEVPAISIDDFAFQRGIDAISCIKIDAENAERKILTGAEQTLRRTKATVIFEGGMDEFKPLGERTSDCTDMLTNLGFCNYVINRDGSFCQYNPYTNYQTTINILSFHPGSNNADRLSKLVNKLLPY